MVDLWPSAKVGPSPSIRWVRRRRRRREAGTNYRDDASLMRRAVAVGAGRRSLEFCATGEGGRARPLGRHLFTLRQQASNQAPRDHSDRNEPTFALSFVVTALHAHEGRSIDVQEVGCFTQERGEAGVCAG